MVQPFVERIAEIGSQNRIYTRKEDRDTFEQSDAVNGSDLIADQEHLFVEISSVESGVKEYTSFGTTLYSDGEFIIPREELDELDLEQGDEIQYRIY